MRPLQLPFLDYTPRFPLNLQSSVVNYWVGLQAGKKGKVVECLPLGRPGKSTFGLQKLVGAKRRSRFAGLLRF